MGKKKKVKKKNQKKNRWIIVGLIIVLLALLVVLWNVINAKKANKQEKNEVVKETVELPYSLDDGKLEVISLFQSTIANPDCNEEDGENIASIEVKNQSGQFLTSANITIKLEDNTELNFRIIDVPADGTVWAFEVNNTEIPEQPVCESVKCEAVYEEENPVMTDQVSVEAEGTTVMISNLTDKDLTNLDVSFHCLFDEGVYYGGTVYTYPIDTIYAGESISMDVSECYLGKAEAVRIIQEK